MVQGGASGRGLGWGRGFGQSVSITSCLNSRCLACTLVGSHQVLFSAVLAPSPYPWPKAPQLLWDTLLPPRTLPTRIADFFRGRAGVPSSMSSLGDQVRDWHQGVLAVASKDWDRALCLFSDVQEPKAKMYFNMGCVRLMAGDPEAALRVSKLPRTGDRNLWGISLVEAFRGMQMKT